MLVYKVKFTGPKGGWSARLFTEVESARSWVESRLALDRQVVIQTCESPGWDTISVGDL